MDFMKYSDNYKSYLKEGFSNEELKNRCILMALNINPDLYFIDFCSRKHFKIESKFFEHFSVRFNFVDDDKNNKNVSIYFERFEILYLNEHNTIDNDCFIENKKSIASKEFNLHLQNFNDFIYKDLSKKESFDSDVNNSVDSTLMYRIKQSITYLYNTNIDNDYLALSSYFIYHYGIMLNKEDLNILIHAYKKGLFGFLSLINFPTRNENIDKLIQLKNKKISEDSKELILLNTRV